MKCGALIYRELRGKKYPKWKILSVASKGYLERNGVNCHLPFPREKYESCDGNMKAKISLDSDGGCCCCSNAYIEVRYTCDKCGNSDPGLVNLPQNQYSLEDFLNFAIDKLE